MLGLCFRFPTDAAAARVAEHLRQLHPLAPPAVRVRREVLRVPDPLWARPLVPEIVVGSLGRLVDETAADGDGGRAAGL